MFILLVNLVILKNWVDGNCKFYLLNTTWYIVCLHKSLVFILICEKSWCCVDLCAFSMTEWENNKHNEKRIITFSNLIYFSDELMFSTKDRANTAKFDLTLISLVQTKGIINHLKCKLIIVNYILAWSASNSNVFFCISLDIFRITFFPMVSRQERYVLICAYIWQSSLKWFSWLLPLYFTWIQNSEVAIYMNCIFKRRFVRIKLYLMSKHLRFLLYCFKCNKLYFYKNEQLYLLATKRLILSLPW